MDSAIDVQPQSVQPLLHLRLIGQMSATATANGQSVLPTGRKTKALLAIVALTAPRPALRGRLSELLWSRRPEEQARASLRQEIHRLLEMLSVIENDVLLITRDHISLNPGTVWLDVAEVMRASPRQAESLTLLEGDLLEDLDGADPAFDSWLAGERERVRDHGRRLAEQVLASYDDPEAVIPAAQRLLGIDRAHEGAWRALMRAYAARGERGMAIQAYDRCRSVLIDLLDAAPSQETQTLLAEIRGPTGPRVSARPTQPVGGSKIGNRGAPLYGSDRDVVSESIPLAASDEPGGQRGIQIGVLPFRHFSADDAEEHIPPALAEEIMAGLARFRNISVVASHSLARFAEKCRDEEAIRRSFGLDLLLDGSIQRVRERVRVSARLLDLRAGNHVAWARRFDRTGDDQLAWQDEMSAEIVAQVDAEILTIESRRLSNRPQPEPNSYSSLMRALPLMYRMDRVSFMRAGDLLREAVELDGEFASPQAWRALWLAFLTKQGWAAKPEETAAEAERLVERAIQLDPSDARALAIAGYVTGLLRRLPQQAAMLQERSINLNPNLAAAWALSALSQVWLGNLIEAERRIARYKVLSPHDPLAFLFDGFVTLIHLLKREFEPAVAAGRVATQMNPMLVSGFKPYLAALGHLGRRQEAAIVLRRLLMLEPDFSVQGFLAATVLQRDVHRDILVQGLRKAGVPDIARVGAEHPVDVVPLRA